MPSLPPRHLASTPAASLHFPGWHELEELDLPDGIIDKSATWRFQLQDPLTIQFMVEDMDGTASRRWFWAFIFDFHWAMGQAKIFYPEQHQFAASVHEVVFFEDRHIVHFDGNGAEEYAPMKYVVGRK